MPFGKAKVDIKSNAKVEKVHPCDPPLPCDPFFELNDCPTPYLCQERLKNPAWHGEITQCTPGSFIYVKSCKKVEPPHICDPLKPCSEVNPKEYKKPQCQQQPIWIERLKNPYPDKKDEPCDPTK